MALALRKKIESDKQAVAAAIPPATSSDHDTDAPVDTNAVKKPMTPPFASVQPSASAAPHIKPVGSFPSPAFGPASQASHAVLQPGAKDRALAQSGDQAPWPQPQAPVQEVVDKPQPQTKPKDAMKAQVLAQPDVQNQTKDQIQTSVQGQSQSSVKPNLIQPFGVPPSTLPVQDTPKEKENIIAEEKAKQESAQQAKTSPAVTVPTKPEAIGEPAPSQEVVDVPVGKIIPNPHQPRLYFNEEKLEELARSIKEHGILQPLTVTKNGENYELIAGERRFQAAKKAGLPTVPVIVRAAEEQQKFELAITENVQRHDLNPIEEAKAYKRLMDEFHLNQEEVAQKMGKSRSAVANSVRLLHLPVEIQRAVAEDKISEGHAKALLAIENPEKQRALFELIVASGLTVREAEAKAREVSERPPKKMKTVDPVLKEKSERLAEIFGTKVKINRSGQGGKIVIEYYGEEDLNHILQKISGERGA